MMELPKSLVADIKAFQTQLKLAIQKHQVIVLKLRTDPLNMLIKKQLADVQNHIIALGDSQKLLIQQLRKELEADSTSSKIVRILIGNSFGDFSCLRTISVNNDSSNSPKSDSVIKERDSPHPFRESKIIRSRSSSVSPTSTIGSDDSEPQRKDIDIPASLATNENIQESNSTLKLQFMSAVGLVTRELLSELQNRRVERKRRSTANHTQFVYGSSWDVSKRKKSNYLMSGSSPVATRNLTRALRSVTSEPQQVKNQQRTTSTSPPALPPAPNKICQTTVLEGVNSPTNIVQSRVAVTESSRQPLQPLTSQTTVPSLSCASGTVSIRIPGLPASLTIERIAAAQQICVVCRKIGSLSTCSSCNAGYHLGCGGDVSKCPQCTIKQEGEALENSSACNPAAVSTSRLILQSYVTQHKPDIKEREAEKHHLMQQNAELNSEKEILEQKAEQLSAALVAQAITKKGLLQSEEKTRKSIQHLHEFIHLIQSAHQPLPPPS